MPQDFPTTGAPPMIGKVLTANEWLDYVANYNFGSLPPSRLVLHHTYRPDENQWRGLASMKGMQSFYAKKGWTAAPHIYVAPDGIWLFTPMSKIGIHAGTGNGSLKAGWYSIGLEMVGYFDHKRPSGAVWEFAKAVMGGLSRRLNIAPRQLISFHRDYTNQKSCPGWAVTKEWVWGEVEAWTNNASPPTPPPPGEIGTPTPSDELLLEALLNESYNKRSQGYNSDWAFHNYAVDHSLGMPMGKSARLNVGGKSYNYQPFARDTLFCEIPNWGDVQTLSDLLSGSIPPSGLGRMLLEATYKAAGATFHADWAFHQYAVSAKLGPPIGESANIVVDGAKYSYQVFALDTLYNRVPHWSEVKQLSHLANESDAAKARLREALLGVTYKAIGTDYHADWAFHQLARSYNIGAPLSKSYKTIVEGKTYALQVYALDTLYNVVPNWKDVRRLKELAVGQGMPSFGVSFAPTAEAASVLGADAVWGVLDQDVAPPIHYNPPSSAFSDRDGSEVSMLVLHGVAGTPDVALDRMTEIGARFATHYYITNNGEVYQLVDEDQAAWHAGVSALDGIWFNLNRISIGVALERPTDWPRVEGGTGAAQLQALCWLVGDLSRRYRITRDSVLIWSSLAGSDHPGTEEVPVGELQSALAR